MDWIHSDLYSSLATECSLLRYTTVDGTSVMAGRWALLQQRTVHARGQIWTILPCDGPDHLGSFAASRLPTPGASAGNALCGSSRLTTCWRAEQGQPEERGRAGDGGDTL